MTDVFILGSGFSRALSSEMPTVRDLAGPLDRYLSAAQHEIPAGPLLGESGDVEALLGYLAEPQPWQSDAVMHKSRAALADTILWLADHIWGCSTAAMEDDAPDALLRLVRRWHDDQSVVISFNYDTLIEAAFVGLREELGFGRSGAGHICLSTLRLPTLSAREGLAVLGGTEDETFKLLKLHGSLNWMYSGDRGGYGDAIYDTRLVGSWGERSSLTFEEIRRTAPGLEVALLPPTPTKLGMMGNGMLRQLWISAAEALATADEIVVVGYSLPASDRIVRSMLSVMAASEPEDERRKKITPVDLDLGILDTLHAIVPTAEVHDQFCGIPDAFERFVASYAS